MILRCLLTCWCALALGQPKGEPEIRCVFRALALSAPLEDAAYQMGRHPVALLIPSDFFSAQQTYRGPADVTFGRLLKPKIPKALSAAVVAEDAAHMEALRADAAYAALAQEGAALVNAAAEGPTGAAQRRRGGELLALADDQAARASQAREMARAARAAATGVTANKPGPQPSGPDDFTRHGRVRLHDGGAHLLLFAETADGWRITATDDAPDQHPFGTLRFVNQGERPLGLRSSGREQALPPGRQVVLRPTVDEHGYAGLELRTAGEDGKTLRTLRVYPEKNARSTYLILDDPSGNLTVKAAHERRQP